MYKVRVVEGVNREPDTVPLYVGRAKPFNSGRPPREGSAFVENRSPSPSPYPPPNLFDTRGDVPI